MKENGIFPQLKQTTVKIETWANVQKEEIRPDPGFVRLVTEAATPIIMERIAEQQKEAQTQQQIYKDNLSVAILISGFATVVSAALSSYLFSIGSLAGIAFFYPTIIGLGTILFLIYKNYKRMHVNA